MSADEYFDDIQDVKVTKDMLDLARHIVNQKAGHFEPDKFEDQYETALIDLINQKRAGKPITAKERPRGENVVDLMDALRKSIGGGAAAETEAPKKPAKKPRKAAAGQKEMLMPIAGKKPAKEAAAKKPAASRSGSRPSVHDGFAEIAKRRAPPVSRRCRRSGSPARSSGRTILAKQG